MNKLLVIGKYGQLAQGFRSISTKDEVIFFDRSEIDVRDVKTLESKILVHNPTHIINTAAFHLLSACEENPEKAFEVNALAILHLAKICKKYTIRFVTYSTDYVFDGEKKEPYTESDVPNPLQMYGISKLAGEYAARNYYSEGAYVIRTNALYGGQTGSKDKNGNFVLSILNQAKNSDSVTISAKMTISPTYAVDLALATYQLLEREPKSGVYHIVNTGTCSWIEFAEAILEIAKIDKEVTYIKTPTPSPIRRPEYSALKSEKIEQLGIVLPSWKKSLKTYIIDELHYA